MDEHFSIYSFYSPIPWRKNQLLTMEIDEQLYNGKDRVH
jgi:hypothetical protein